METIYQQVFNKIKTDVVALSSYSPIVTKLAPQQLSKFPTIEVVEDNNILQSETLDKIEKFSRLTYTVKIYTQDTDDEVSKVVVAEELVNLVNNIMENSFGMTRTACTRQPNLDLNVYAFLLRYECVLDEKNSIIYRRR